MEKASGAPRGERSQLLEELNDQEVAQRFAALQRQLEDMDPAETERIGETAADKSIQGADFAGLRKSHQAPPSIFESR